MRSFRISVQLEELILNECFASRSVMSMSPTNCLAGRKCGRYRGMSGRRQSEPKERHDPLRHVGALNCCCAINGQQALFRPS